MKKGIESEIAHYMLRHQKTVEMALQGPMSTQLKRDLVSDMDTILLRNSDASRMNPYERVAWIMFRSTRNRIHALRHNKAQRLVGAFTAAVPLLAASTIRKAGQAIGLVGDGLDAAGVQSAPWLQQQGQRLVAASNRFDYWIGNTFPIFFEPRMLNDPHKLLVATGKAPATYQLSSTRSSTDHLRNYFSPDRVGFHFRQLMASYNQAPVRWATSGGRQRFYRAHRDLADAILFQYRDRSRLSLDERLSRDELRVCRDVMASHCRRDNMVGRVNGVVSAMVSAVTVPLRFIASPLARGPILRGSTALKYVLAVPILAAKAVVATASGIDYLKNRLLPLPFEALSEKWQPKLDAVRPELHPAATQRPSGDGTSRSIGPDQPNKSVGLPASSMVSSAGALQPAPLCTPRERIIAPDNNNRGLHH